MSYVIVGVLSSLGTVAALYLWMKYVEWTWREDEDHG